MIHGVSAPGLAARLYFNRYTEDAVDLCDILSSFAPHTKASLNELSKIMGLPGKLESIDGTDVERYFLEIADYCEMDVINTYRVWLRYELFRGRLGDGEHQASERSLADFIGTRVNRQAVGIQRPALPVADVQDLHGAAGEGRVTPIDTWVAALFGRPEHQRAESLYDLLVRLNLSMSHLEDAHETYPRRLGLR